MVYIRTDENNMITYVHSQPFDSVNGLGESREELEKTGYFIDSMPQPQSVMGQRAIPYFNPETKKVSYNYIAAPVSNRERLDSLESALNAVLMMGVLNTSEEIDSNETIIETEEV